MANLRPDLNSPRNFLSFELSLESSRALDREISRFKDVYIVCIKMQFFKRKFALGDFVPNFGEKPLWWVRMRFLCHNYNNSLISTQKFGGFFKNLSLTCRPGGL